MPTERFYIYRSAASNACALTREKDDSRLPPNGWHFWMQASGHQSEDGLYGFAWKTAEAAIAARGFYLFTGSIRLLDGPVPARPETPEGPINV
jgi:hypothetical protein